MRSARSYTVTTGGIPQLQRLRRQIAQQDAQLRGPIRRRVAARMRKEVAPEIVMLGKRRASLLLPGGAQGLGGWVAKARGTVTVRYTGRWAGIRIRLSRRNSRGRKADLARIDRGRARHPVYGRWPGGGDNAATLQSVPVNWWTGVDKAARVRARTAALRILDEVADELERR